MHVRLVVLGLAPLFLACPVLSQQDNAPSTEALSYDSSHADRTEFKNLNYDREDVCESPSEESPSCSLVVNATPAGSTSGDSEAHSRSNASKVELAVEKTRPLPPDDVNRSIYYRNKLEFSVDSGWFPINIPFPFDFMLNSDYNTYPLKYTLVPVIASLRWQLGNLRGPMILRGNWDLEFSGGVVAIPRGPETRYFTYMMGMRRNFVPRNWRVTPYFDWRMGLGNIDAKGPLGVPYAQGQNFTFTLNMGSGFRYNFNPRYGLTLGLNWMHISNANLSEGSPPNWGYRNYGINVYGPIVGLDVQLRRQHRHSE